MEPVTSFSVGSLVKARGREWVVLPESEEDLLVLPCIMHAPEGTAIYYGQPNQGIVKIMVTKEAKKKARETLSSM